MRPIRKFANRILCALLLMQTGCWMGGNVRSGSPTPALRPPAPTLNSPQYGPVDPINPVPPSAPTLDGPAFPQS